MPSMKPGDKVRVIAKDYFEGWEGTVHSVGESQYGVVVEFPENSSDKFDFRPEELEVIEDAPRDAT